VGVVNLLLHRSDLLWYSVQAVLQSFVKAAVLDMIKRRLGSSLISESVTVYISSLDALAG
jgi:hypothetical protein